MKLSFKSILQAFISTACVGMMSASFGSSTTNDVQIAVGTWGYSYFRQYPMILLDSLQGDSWTLLKTLSIPNIVEADLKAASCDGNICNAVGTYQNNDKTASFPLLMNSQDKGQNWTMVNKIYGIPTTANRSYVKNIHCNEGTCVAVGKIYNDKTEEYLPLLLVSKDNGLSWSYNNSGLASYSGEGELSLVTHTGNIWIIGGFYGRYPTPSHFEPTVLFLISRDDGKTWQLLIESIDLPPSLDRTKLIAMQCNDNICIAVGENDTGYGEDAKTFIMRSSNHGKTWSMVEQPANLPPSTATDPYLQAISCVGNTCVTAGAWAWSHSVYQLKIPLLLVSHDKGVSWSSVNNAKNKPANAEGAVFESVSCSGHSCIAGGRFAYKENISGLPFLMSSQNRGQSWSFVTKILNLPTQFKDAVITKVNCNKNNCTVVGWWDSNWCDWRGDDNSKRFPMILVSHDSGQTWVYVQNIKDFPADAQSSIEGLHNI